MSWLPPAMLLCLGCSVEIHEGGSWACPSGECPAGFMCVEDRCVARHSEPSDTPMSEVDGPLATSDAQPGRAGDRCEAAVVVSTRPVHVQGSLAGAVDDYDPPGCSSDGVEVIYAVPLASSREVSVRLSGADFDGSMYTTTSCPPTDYFVCSSFDAGASSASTRTSYPGDGAFAYVVIERESGSGTSFELDFE